MVKPVHPASHDHGPGHDDGHGHSYGHEHANAHASAHSHAEGHGHTHAHGHGHHHAAVVDGAGGLRRAFVIGIALNLGFVVLELGTGFWSHSLALVADAGHNFADVIGLVLALAATLFAQRRPSPQFTYGLQASTILAALSNAMILLVVTGAIIWASIGRLQQTSAVNSNAIMWVAALGVLVNAGSALLFLSGRHDDLNVRGAFLHLAGDAAVSLGVIGAGAIISVTGWLWLDPAVSLVIATVILVGTWDLLRQSLRLALQAAPSGVDCEAVRHFLAAQPGVGEVHDLHVWAMSTTENALTAHLVMPRGHPGDGFLDALAGELDTRFKLGHVTLQVETGDAQTCRLASSHA